MCSFRFVVVGGGGGGGGSVGADLEKRVKLKITLYRLVRVGTGRNNFRGERSKVEFAVPINRELDLLRRCTYIVNSDG